jgi:aspartyl/asparaginyl beta-hydroxylase (cupin superfamily)
MRHAGGRSLLDHLADTYEILRRWGQPEWLAHAALIHSVYGTERYRQQLIPLRRRSELSDLAGARAERLAYLFSAVPRGPLLAGTYRWSAPPLRGDGDHGPPNRAELDALVLLHMANIAEQARAEDGSPGRWLARVRQLGELLIDSEALAPPLFIAKLATLTEEEENLARVAYRDGVGAIDSGELSADRLALAASLCPALAEPCVWLAYLAGSRGDSTSAAWWAGCADGRLLELGTAWDKRLSFGQWRELAAIASRTTDGDHFTGVASAAHPVQLFEAVMQNAARGENSRGAHISRSIRPPNPAAARKRFHRYVETLAQGERAALGAMYPDLPSQPWLDPDDFSLPAYLESHYAAIREEILSLSSASFHREAERIGRSGDWDVAFFYERGRRRDEICQACPVTTRGLEAYGAIRTLAGLAYASRMRAGTHIQAHRGPTNLRVRCHLGILIPEGDCAIRVGDETRHWQEGRCLVFDDHFEHKAWNRTREDRIVLIVDLWHPGLASTEVRLLEGLQAHAAAHARKLSRYWAANAAAAQQAS